MICTTRHVIQFYSPVSAHYCVSPPQQCLNCANCCLPETSPFQTNRISPNEKLIPKQIAFNGQIMGFHSSCLLDALRLEILEIAYNFKWITIKMAWLVYVPVSILPSPSLTSLVFNFACLLIMMEEKAFNIEFGTNVSIKQYVVHWSAMQGTWSV